ncbi:MAG: hypothetical protein IRZ08_20395, partial [Frankia sp.]|nr:hypothetical protein [Frankia sp.]
MGAHHRDPPVTDGVPRPVFDEAPRGYDREQVDGYIQALWRYSSDLTVRAATAEAALRHERERLSAELGVPEGAGSAAGAGTRIGRMLSIAEQIADELVSGAREIAEQVLYEAVRDAAADHPIVHEAREQADKLLRDAVAEARRLATERHADLEAEIARAQATLDTLRHQQGELLGAMLRLRRLIGSVDVEAALADLARAGTGRPGAARGGTVPPPPRPAPEAAAPGPAAAAPPTGPSGPVPPTAPPGFDGPGPGPDGTEGLADHDYSLAGSFATTPAGTPP